MQKSDKLPLKFDKFDKLLPLNTLKASRYQKNKHPPEQIKRLAKIMKEHGIRQPIHVSKKTGEVVFGHGRWEAAKLNKWEVFPVVYQDFKNAEEEFSCVQSDNAIAHWADLDLPEIKADLKDFPKLDIELLGIENFEIEKKGLVDEDSVPENVPAISKTGDLWLLGGHRVLCGDSTNIEDVERLMNGEKADMVFTDPPYGMDLDTDYSKMAGKGTKYSPVIGDDSAFDPSVCFGFCKEVFLFGGDYFIKSLPDGGSWIVWDKRSKADGTIGVVSENQFGSSFELIWTKIPHKRSILRTMWAAGLGEGLDEKRKGRNNVPVRYHPTQKPIKLIEEFFGRYAHNFKTILDLFLGSGSTLIACEKTNRRCFGMEIDPHYVDVIVKRWEQFTGKKAKRG